jgi:hypothetical protein
VTHQGSPPAPPDGLLPANSTASACQPQTPARPPAIAAWRCRFCGCRCAESVRPGFLRRRVPLPVHHGNPKRSTA